MERRGDRLIVESCSPTGCRFRIVDPVTGSQLIDDDGSATSSASRTTGCSHSRIARLPPCRLLERNIATGAHRELHPAAYDAWLVEVTNGQRD